MRKKNRSSLIRWLILGVILVGSMVIHYLHINGGSSYPSVHAICPYGGIENLWAWLAGQANIQKIFSGTMVLFFLTVIVAILFRRGFCGNICPMGALQELIGLITRKKVRVPQKVDKPLRYLKYSILVLSVVMAWATASLWMSPFDPWAAFSHISTGGEIFAEFFIGAILLIITIVLSPFINRVFCRYLCPAGALYGIIGKLSPSKVVRDHKTCVQCGACNKACPMDIDVQHMEAVTTAECINCNRCVDVCPGAGTMISAKVGKRVVKPLIVILATVVIFFGSIMVLDAAGLYSVSIPSVEKVVESQEYLQIADLRGSMTIEEGAFYTGMGLEDFYEAMKIPNTVPSDTQMKSIATLVPGYDFHVIKAENGGK